MLRKASYSAFLGLHSHNKIKGLKKINNNYYYCNYNNLDRKTDYFSLIKCEQYVCDREAFKSFRHDIDTFIMNALFNNPRPEFQPLPPTGILPRISIMQDTGLSVWREKGKNKLSY